MSNTKKATGAAKRTSRTKKTPDQPDLGVLLGEDDRPEDTVPICLRGSLVAEWSRLKAEYDAGPGDEDKALMVERAAKQRLAEQMAEVEAKMRAGTVHFRLRALPRKRVPAMAKDDPTWQELIQAHPPRKDDKGKVVEKDAGLQVNADTFFDALVRASVVEPAMTTEQWTQLDAKLNDAQFQRLAMAAWALNRSEVDVPFSRAVSMMRMSDAESRRQNESASPPAGSRAGSRSSSRSTSTTATDG